MNNKLLILICVLLSSCATQKTTFSPYGAVYSSEGGGCQPPSFLLFRTCPQIFEIYVPHLYESIFGQWRVINDTLFLFPELEGFYRDSTIKIQSQLDTSVATIPQKYLIKEDCLIDMTDYNGLLPAPFDKMKNGFIFKRVN